MTEKLSELEQLAQQAEQVDAAEVSAAGGDERQDQAAPPVQSNAEQLAGLFMMAREAFCFVVGVKSPRRVLDDMALVRLGDAWGRVADKRGWDLSKWMGDYAAEVAAVSTTITIGVAVVKAVQTEVAAMNKAADAPKPDGVVIDGDAG